MKKWMWILSVVLMTSAGAQANGLGVYGSYWKTKDADDGFGGGARLNIGLGDILGIDLRGGYFPDLAKDEDPYDLDLRVIPAEAGLTINLPLSEQAIPYVGGGAGYYFIDAKVKGPGVDESADVDNQVGWYAVAGLQIKLSGQVALFGEGKYTGVEAKAKDDKMDDLDQDLDFDLSGFGANAGLMLIW